MNTTRRLTLTGAWRVVQVSALIASLCHCGSQKKAAPPPEVAAKPSDTWRNDVPKAGPQPALHAPVPQKQTLSNGLTVLTHEKSGLPLLTAQVVIRSGSAQDPPKLPGLASFTAEMLRAGTLKRTAEAISKEVESRGTSIDIETDEDAITISVTALKENFDAVFEVVADVVQHARFVPEEVERTRRQRLESIRLSQDAPAYVANYVFRQALYGSHPYGHAPLGTREAIEKIKHHDLFGFYTHFFQPSNAGVVVVGDLPAAAAVKLVENRLGLWKGATEAQKAPPVPEPGKSEVLLVDRPDAPQSQLVLGMLAASRSDPDYYTLGVLNSILGGAFNSRINMNLREDKGYTYGARSYFDFMRGRGPFFVQTGVRTDATAPAIREVLREIDGIRQADVSDEELNNAKNRYILSLPGLFQGVDGISDNIATLFVYDLPLDNLQKIPEHVSAISKADVRRVAQKFLDPGQLIIVVNGDKAKIGESLDGLQRGAVRQTNAEGKTLSQK